MKHLSHYLGLIAVFTTALAGIYFFSYDRRLQMGVVISTGVAYILWGVIHHYLHKDLYMSVIIEYLIVAAIGLILVFSLIFRV